MASRAPTPIGTADAGADQAGANTNTNAGADNQTATDTNATAGANASTDQAPVDDHTVEARILRDHGAYHANTFALVTETEAKSGAGDWLDTDADAVAYVKAQEG